MGRSTRQVVYSSLPGAPPLLPPSSSASSFRSTRRRQPTSPSTDQFDDHENDVEEGDSDASSFKDEEVADLGSSSEDEFVRPPVRIRDASGPMGPGGAGESSAESLGRVIGGVEGKEEGGVRDWLGVSLPVRSTSKSGPTTVDAVQPPPRTSSTADPSRPRSPLTPPLTSSTSQFAPHPRSQSHGRSTSKSSSINDQLRRELPALHTSFESAPSAKEREHQQEQALRKKDGVSPPPYAHSPAQGGGPSVHWANNEHKQALLGPPSLPSSSRASDREAGDGHAHRDGYTNSPSLFRLPDLAANSKSLDFGAAPGVNGEGLFDPTSFNLAQFARPSGFVGLLVESRVVRTLLAESTILDVVALWRSLTTEEQQTVERERDVVEEMRVWGLGWAGYVRGAGSELELKGGWDRVGVNVVLEFCEFPFSRLCLPKPQVADEDAYCCQRLVSSLLEPPKTAFPPSQVLSISLATLLLRASHAALPPPGPHLIPFEEEDVLPPPLQPTPTALNPKTRMRGLPAGRLLVLPSPLAAQPQQSASNGSKSAVEGRNGAFSPLSGGGRSGAPSIQGSLNKRRSSISESVGIHWGGGKSSNGGYPPSAFTPGASSGRLAASSASIYSVDNKSKLAPPPPRLPEARRYEFQQPNPGQPGRRHRRQASDSQSLASTAFGGQGSSVYRQRGVSAGPSSVNMLAGSNSFGGGQSPDLGRGGSWLPDLNAPPVPAFAQPLRKSASKDGSWTSIPNGGSSSGRGSHSASTSFLGGNKWETTSSSESSSGRVTRRRSENQLVEPAFLSLTSPYRYGRAPLVKIVVPFLADVVWPSGPALKLCHRHLDTTGLLSKMKLGDLVENLAVSWRVRNVEGATGGGWTTGTMVYIPPYLHPLSTTHSHLGQQAATVNSPSGSAPSSASGGSKVAHLPASLNMFLLPPTYYHSVVPPPYIIYLDLQPFAAKINETLRLANQRGEVLSAGGDVLSLDQWVHEAGFFVEEPGPWEGTMVTLEADGTKEVSFPLALFSHCWSRACLILALLFVSKGQGRAPPARRRVVDQTTTVGDCRRQEYSR